jgi:hypothetical protein
MTPEEHCICDHCWPLFFRGQVPVRAPAPLGFSVRKKTQAEIDQTEELAAIAGDDWTTPGTHLLRVHTERPLNVCCWCLSLTRSGIFLNSEQLGPRSLFAGLQCESLHFAGQ